MLPLAVLLGQAAAESPVTSRADEFGLTGDAADNSLSLQRGLDDLAFHGGGKLVIPAGTYSSGPLRVPSRVELHLAAGARLVLARGPEDYPSENGTRPSLISISDAENVRISGEGTIDGRGAAWWQAFLEAKAAQHDLRRPQLIRIDRCKNVEISGITTLNPPNTHVSARDSEDVVFRGLTMTAPDDSPNTDAINLGRMKRVLIEDCTISTGDDNVAIIASGKPGDTPATEDITIRNCTFGFGHGLSIGSYTSAGIEKLRVEHVTFNGTSSGIRLKSNATRGGVVRDLEYRNLKMTNVRYPIFIASHYPKLPPQPGETTVEGDDLPRWSDILIDTVTILGCKNGPIVWGLPQAHVERLTLRNVTLEAEQGGVVVHASATFENASITPASGPPLRTFDARANGIESVPLEGRFKPK